MMSQHSRAAWSVRITAILLVLLLVPACDNGDDGAPGPAGTPGSADAWSRLGNAGTVDGTNFLGTTDNVPFTIRANNLQAVRIEPNATSPNVIQGFDGNFVTAGAAG